MPYVGTVLRKKLKIYAVLLQITSIVSITVITTVYKSFVVFAGLSVITKLFQNSLCNRLWLHNTNVLQQKFPANYTLHTVEVFQICNIR